MSDDDPVLSADEIRSFAAVLDEIIPPDAARGLPGAGEIGLAPELDTRVPALRPGLRAGLARLAEAALAAGADDFAAQSGSDRVKALTDLSATDPGFLPGLLFHAYSAYYQHPRVLEALGLEVRPPFPQGYPMEPTDPELLEQVRRRGPLYRDC